MYAQSQSSVARIGLKKNCCEWDQVIQNQLGCNFSCVCKKQKLQNANFWGENSKTTKHSFCLSPFEAFFGGWKEWRLLFKGNSSIDERTKGKDVLQYICSRRGITKERKDNLSLMWKRIKDFFGNLTSSFPLKFPSVHQDWAQKQRQQKCHKGRHDFVIYYFVGNGKDFRQISHDLKLIQCWRWPKFHEKSLLGQSSCFIWKDRVPFVLLQIQTVQFLLQIQDSCRTSE